MALEEKTLVTQNQESVQTVAAVSVRSDWNEEALPELTEACFLHARDTMKPGDKMDWFVGACGIFAIGCLGVTVYNIAKYGFDLLFGVMIAAYVVVAFFCLCLPLQKKLSKAGFSRSLPKRLMSGRLSRAEVTFSADSLTYQGKTEETVSYERLWDLYETEHYLVFHLNDRSILPFEKTALAQAEATQTEQKEQAALSPFFEGLLKQYARAEQEKQKEAGAKD